jgi:hypothetical protein
VVRDMRSKRVGMSGAGDYDVYNIVMGVSDRTVQ